MAKTQKIHAITSKGISAVLIPEKQHQSLYRINNCIIAAQDKEILQYASKLSKVTPSTSNIAELIAEFMKGSKIRKEAYVLSNKDNYILKGNSIREIAQSRNKAGLDDILFRLYEETNNPEEFQLGICYKNNAKLLFPPETSIEYLIEEYSVKKSLSSKKASLNNRVYVSLNSLLKQASKKGNNSIKQEDSLLSLAREKIKTSNIRKKASNLLEEYISNNYSLCNSLLLKDSLRDIEKKAKLTIIAPKQKKYSPKELQELLDDNLLARKEKSLILKTLANNADKISSMLAREAGLIARKLNHSRSYMITGDKADIDRIYHMHKSRDHKKLSSELAKELRQGSMLFYDKGIYTPEVMHSFIENEGIIPIAPIRPTSKKFSSLWNLENIGALKAQEITCGQGAVGAIIDTGIDYEHKELAHLFGEEKGWDFVDNNDDPQDYNGHGTHVAGTAAGNSTGIACSSRLYALRVLDENGMGMMSSTIEAVNFAIANGIDVINLSLGSPSYSELENLTFKEAAQHKIIVIAAAGNEGYGPSYPASYDSTISVAALNRDNSHASFSNVWETTEISAPGVKIYSSIPGNNYALLSGTSMASPHVAGAALLAKSLNKNISLDDFRRIMYGTAELLGDNQDEKNRWKYGAGLIRIDRIVKER